MDEPLIGPALPPAASVQGWFLQRLTLASAGTVARSMRCLYVDLDGTLLGPEASLLRGADGRFSRMGVRALEACFRADVEVVLYSGRRQSACSRAPG